MRALSAVLLLLVLVAPAPARAAIEDEPLHPVAGGGVRPPAAGVPAGEADLGRVADADADGRDGVLVISLRGLWRVDGDGLLRAVRVPPGSGSALEVAAARTGGGALAIFAGSRALWRLPADGGEPERVAELPFAPRHLAVLGDGTAVLTARDALVRVTPEGVAGERLPLPGAGVVATAGRDAFVVAAAPGLRRFEPDGTSSPVDLGRLEPDAVTGLAVEPDGAILVSGHRRLADGIPPMQLLLRNGDPFTPDGRAFVRTGRSRSAIRRRVLRVEPGSRPPVDVLSEGGVGARWGSGHGVTLDEASEQPRAIVPLEDGGALVVAGGQVLRAGGQARPAAWLDQHGFARMAGAQVVYAETATPGSLTVLATRGPTVVARGQVEVRRPGPVEVALDAPLPSVPLHLALRLRTDGGRVGASGAWVWPGPVPAVSSVRRLAARVAARAGRRTTSGPCAPRSAARIDCAWSRDGRRRDERLRVTARPDGFLLELAPATTRSRRSSSRGSR